MKRNILFSLMMIGAVAALISGATFSAFTDSAQVTGTITAGNVDVSFGETTVFNWTPDLSCPESPAGSALVRSGTTCTSTVNVIYSGTITAKMTLTLGWTGTNSSCFNVTAQYGATAFINGPDPAPLEHVVNPVTPGTYPVTVTVGLPAGAANTCQNATINLTLTVTTTDALT